MEHENEEAQTFLWRAFKPRPSRDGSDLRCPVVSRKCCENTITNSGSEEAAEIRAAMVRKQKTGSRDALHILDLLTNRFPRIWVPSPSERDLRQMLRHRQKLVRFIRR